MLIFNFFIWLFFRTFAGSEVAFHLSMKILSFDSPTIYCQDYLRITKSDGSLIQSHCNDQPGLTIWNADPLTFTSITHLLIKYRIVSGGKFWIVVQGEYVFN